MSKKTVSSPIGTSVALSTFCEELYPPLEEIFNLIYVATHEQVDAAQSQRCMGLAFQRLDQIRQVVLSHCKRDGREKRRAS
jgi:hypothetical protein